jgi:hypothetical protein
VDAHRKSIFCLGERPQLYNSGIPIALQDLLENSWDGNVSQRYSMVEAVVRLEDILCDSRPTEPLSRADSSSFDTCLATASSIIWESLTELWNLVLKDFKTELNEHEGRESNILDSCMVSGSSLQIETVVDKCKRLNFPDPPPSLKNQIQVQQVPRSHHYEQLELFHRKRVDHLYKDRLLRSIHSAHGTGRVVVGPAPPNQVVSPSA